MSKGSTWEAGRLPPTGSPDAAGTAAGCVPFPPGSGGSFTPRLPSARIHHVGSDPRVTGHGVFPVGGGCRRRPRRRPTGRRGAGPARGGAGGGGGGGAGRGRGPGGRPGSRPAQRGRDESVSAGLGCARSGV